MYFFFLLHTLFTCFHLQVTCVPLGTCLCPNGKGINLLENGTGSGLLCFPFNLQPPITWLAFLHIFYVFALSPPSFRPPGQHDLWSHYSQVFWLIALDSLIYLEILDDPGCLWWLSWFPNHNLPRSPTPTLFLVFQALLLNPKPFLLSLVSHGYKQTVLSII